MTVSGRRFRLFQALHLEDNWLDTIRAAGDEVVFIFHPGAEIALCHQDHDDLVNVIPRPITFEAIWTLSQIIHCKFISNLEEGACSFVNIWTAIFFSQILMVESLQYGNLAGWKWGHLLFPY
jgi:hypothetical protein